MKVALVTHNVIRGDGQGRVNYELVHHALQQGIKVELLADSVDESLLDAGAEWTPVRPRLTKINLFKVGEFVRRADNILRTRGRDFDVVHGNGFVQTVPHHVNSAHMVHGAWLHSQWNPTRRPGSIRAVYHNAYTRLNARWERTSYRSAKIVVAVSPTVRDELITIGVPSKKIRVILNGVDTQEFAPRDRKRSELNLPENVPLALFAGDIRTRLKNLETVLRALRGTRGVHLAVAGDPVGSPFPAMARELGIVDRVHFLGFRRDLPALMNAVDAFVFPSRYESFSLVVLEAMSSALPVITAKTVGASALITPDSGIVIENPDDVQSLEKAISYVLEDRARGRAMGNNARYTAEKYNWSEMGALYMKLYEEVLA